MYAVLSILISTLVVEKFIYFIINTVYISMAICHCFPKDVYCELYLQSIYILLKYVNCSDVAHRNKNILLYPTDISMLNLDRRPLRLHIWDGPRPPCM